MQVCILFGFHTTFIKFFLEAPQSRVFLLLAIFSIVKLSFLAFFFTNDSTIVFIFQLKTPRLPLVWGVIHVKVSFFLKNERFH